MFISDLKLMDTCRHRTYTGADNHLIHDNLRKLSELDKKLILRIPVIPHINDDEENITQTADFILEEMNNRVETLQLLSFMRLGVEKYESLGREYPMKDIRFSRPSFQKHVKKIAEYFNGRGINCIIGTGINE